MSGPVPAFVQLPLDSGNTGKKTKTSSIVQGADTVHRHHFVGDRAANVLGVYSAGSGVQSVSATVQNGTATGFLWLHVPAAVTGKKVRIRKVCIKANVSAATPTMPTLPRVGLTRFTFTGTASGATLAGTPMDATYPAHVLDIRTAVTGLTPTLTPSATSALAQTIIPPFIVAGTSANVQQTNNNEDDLIQAQDEDDYIVLAPGQGIVLWQMDAGTTTDIRRFTVDLKWDEIDVA